MKEVCNYIQRGKSPKYSETKKYPVISQKCIRWSGLDLKPAKYITEDSLKKYEEVRFLCENDILWNSTGTGTVGRAAIYHNNLNPFSLAVADSHVTVLRPMNVCSSYIHNFIMSPHVQVGFEDLCDGSTNQKELSLTTVSEFLIPLPPQSEQQRISETVETLLELVDSIESGKIELSNLIKQTKVKVLDLAIKGKLVPQDPNDEPADKLLEKIKEEKEKLIKEGKLKRDKNETYIFKNSDDNSYYEQIDGETVCIDDDLPFEIPNSWIWCRLSNICNYIQRGKSPKYTELKKYPVISQKCVRWSGLNMQPAKFITEESLKKYEEVRFLRDNDILWNSTGTGTVGRAVIYNSKLNPFNIAVADSHVTVLRPMFVESLYIYDFIMSPHIQVGFEDLCDGSTNQKELSLTTVSEFLIPLPPVDEQKRISEAVENIFLYLDKLESIIKGS